MAQASDLNPLEPELVLANDESAGFFFPFHYPLLRRRLQVLPVEQVDGWQQALDGKPMDLAFRLAQGVDGGLRAQATDELRTSRDKKIIAMLVEATMNFTGGERSSRGLFHGASPYKLLIAIGDQHGDVYDSVREKIEAAAKTQPLGPAYSLAGILGHVDPDRAIKDFRKWIDDVPPNKAMRNVAVGGLSSIESEEAINLAIDLIVDKEVGDTAVEAVYQMIDKRTPDGQRAKLRRLAQQRLTDPTPPPTLSKDGQRNYRWLVDNLDMVRKAGQP
jgi:hypothetical protein